MISIKTEKEIEIMAEGGKILAKIMKELEKEVRPGITTKELDRLAESLVSCPPKPWAKEDKIRCSFKGYEDYPACLCTSINEEIVHAVPSDRILREGDIISLDLGIIYKSFHTDMAVTVPIGKISSKTQKLVEVTKKALEIGIKEVKPGNYLGDIGYIIQKYVESQGFGVVRELCGHGIGRKIHEDPEILNFGERKTGAKIQEGMILCLEPMVTVGDWRIKKSEDGFGYKTKDNSLSAHFEHTIAAIKEGFKVLTEI